MRSLTAAHCALRPARRPGMTLIEVMIALVMLSTVLVGMGVFMAQYGRSVGTSSANATARELVAERLEYVKGTVQYPTIEVTYGGFEASIPGYPGFTRRTLVMRVGGRPNDRYDHKVITVIVNGPGLLKPVKKTSVISAF
jgi:prepilin-type N-terminal cleavage/methylation domain-containing protein